MGGSCENSDFFIAIVEGQATKGHTKVKNVPEGILVFDHPEVTLPRQVIWFNDAIAKTLTYSCADLELSGLGIPQGPYLSLISRPEVALTRRSVSNGAIGVAQNRQSVHAIKRPVARL